MDAATISLIVLCAIGGLLLLTIFFKVFKWISAIGIILVGGGGITEFVMNTKKEGYNYTRNNEDPEHPEDELVDGTVWANPKYTSGLGWIL